MTLSIAVPSTSTSPRCDVRPALVCASVSAKHLTDDERAGMYALLEAYFDGTRRTRFEADLREKDTVILLRDALSGRIRGFSTLMRLTEVIDGQEVVAFFSGDTIVDREYRGETLLSRIWSRTVFAEVDRIAAESPGTAIYWYLICSGYKTFRFLPLFFRSFYPNLFEPTPPRARRILEVLGAGKFGDEYLSDAGIVRFRDATPLKPGVAAVTEGRLRDPHVEFFVRRNPGHAAGDELACLAELSRSNLTRAGQRMMQHPP